MGCGPRLLKWLFVTFPSGAARRCWSNKGAAAGVAAAGENTKVAAVESVTVVLPGMLLMFCLQITAAAVRAVRIECK